MDNKTNVPVCIVQAGFFLFGKICQKTRAPFISHYLIELIFLQFDSIL